MGDNINEVYFESYEDLQIHELMLRDDVRNNAYRTAIMDNQDRIKGKRVLDVGAGTGILSVFCAQAGAKQVFAVEASNLAQLCQQVVDENNFGSIIKVINSKIEDVTVEDLNGKIDVLVSEWMGFYLLHEGMLDSVLSARDRLLESDGLIFPETASIYAAPCSVPEKFEFWDDVSGVSMKKVSKALKSSSSTKPDVRIVQKDNLLADGSSVCWFELADVTVDDLNQLSYTEITCAKRNGKYQGICIWFECVFPSSKGAGVILSTSPFEKSTHWKQSVIILPTEIEVEKGEPIAFELQLTRAEDNNRRYNIALTMLDPQELDHPIPCPCYMTKCIVTKAFLEQRQIQ